MTALQRVLAARIARDGPMTFRDFMAQALYHPEHGYYTTGRPWQGRGDFTTAPRYGDVFAAGLANLALQAKEAMGPGRFEVVEVGSGSGQLAAQLHGLLKDHGMRVRSVEHRRPPRLPREVPWTATVEGLGLRGAFVSNELFDALPVHLVTRGPRGLRELWVAEREGRLTFEAGAVSRPEVMQHLARFGMEPEEGHVVEVGLDALVLLRQLAANLDEGVLVTVDYGDTARGLLARGPQGTLAATREHRVAPDPLAAPGEQDLTAHVNFTALEEEGRALGLEPLANLPQWEFLAATGALDGLAAKLQGPDFAEALAAKTLLAPGRMGEFRVLVQAQGLAAAARERLARRLARGRTLRT